MAKAKKSGKKANVSLKKTLSKKTTKRVTKGLKLKTTKTGTLLKIKVVARIHETINHLHQELSTKIGLFQKQTEKMNTQILKGRDQAQKANAKFKEAEEKMAVKGIFNKSKLKALKSKADKTERIKVALEKELALVQKPLEELTQELTKLKALEKSIKTFDKNWMPEIKQKVENKKLDVQEDPFLEKRVIPKPIDLLAD